MRAAFSWFVGSLLLVSSVAVAAAELPADLFGPADLARLASVDEPAFAPDGKSIVYTVTVTNAAEDKQQSDLWRVGYDGGEARVLTQLVVYPGEHHGLEVPSYLQDRLERLLGWNVRYLMPGDATAR